MINIKKFALILCSTTALIGSLSSCAPTLFSGTSYVGSAIVEERGLKGAAMDAKIRTQINLALVNYNFDVYNRLTINIREGKVLITGGVDTQEQRLEIIRRIWTVNGVKEVIDEMKIGARGTLTDYARDSWITTQLRTKILFNKQIRSVNYNIQTINAVVYLLGVAQSQAELDEVTRIASLIPHTKQVISYVRIKTASGGLSDAAPAPMVDGGAPVTQAAPREEVHIDNTPSTHLPSSTVERLTPPMEQE